ncbi:MAG: hypothetical protein ABIP51_20415 [Bacteroidia bacterium]
METVNNIASGETETTTKTGVLSASVITLEVVLNVLKSNGIEHKALATDQDGRTILLVTYKESQQSIINDIVRLMNFFDEAAALFIPLLKAALTKLQDDSEQILEELGKKHEFKKSLNLASFNPQPKKEQNNGND